MSSISPLQASGLDTVTSAKPTVDAVSTASAATQSGSSTSAPVVNYPSPVFSIDAASGRVIFEYRDASTGQITHQLPSKDAVQLYELSATRGQELQATSSIITKG